METSTLTTCSILFLLKSHAAAIIRDIPPQAAKLYREAWKSVSRAYAVST